jgi:hypothetical protein
MFQAVVRTQSPVTGQLTASMSMNHVTQDWARHWVVRQVGLFAADSEELKMLCAEADELFKQRP